MPSNQDFFIHLPEKAKLRGPGSKGQVWRFDPRWSEFDKATAAKPSQWRKKRWCQTHAAMIILNRLYIPRRKSRLVLPVVVPVVLFLFCFTNFFIFLPRAVCRLLLSCRNFFAAAEIHTSRSNTSGLWAASGPRDCDEETGPCEAQSAEKTITCRRGRDVTKDEELKGPVRRGFEVSVPLQFYTWVAKVSRRITNTYTGVFSTGSYWCRAMRCSSTISNGAKDTGLGGIGSFTLNRGDNRLAIQRNWLNVDDAELARTQEHTRLHE